MEGKICPKCREILPEKAFYCALCGAALQEAHPTERGDETGLAAVRKEEGGRGCIRGVVSLAVGLLYYLILEPIAGLAGDDGTMGRHFSNTQLPPG